MTDTLIAAYDDYTYGLIDIRNYQREGMHRVRDHEDHFDRRILRMELSLRCHFCRTGLKRYQNEDHYIYVADAYKRKGLESTVGMQGYQTTEFVGVCPNCGYWIGHGTRDLGEGPWMQRVACALVQKFSIDSADVPVEHLMRYLGKNQDKLLTIDPFKAEELVAHLLRDHLDCDVLHVGGRKDRGVDAYVLHGKSIRTIVQVKWRRDNRGGESVKTVREFIGTLVPRGVPRGILVTTKNHLTPDALAEIREAEASPLIVESLSIDYKTYQDLLAMIDVSTRKLGEWGLSRTMLLKASAHEGLFG